MKKSIFKKLGGLFLGLAMGLGVAVGVTAGNKASEVNAGEFEELFSISSADVVNNSSYTNYKTTIDERGWIITFGGNNKSVGTNSGNRSKCNLSSYSKYAVSPVTTSDLASAFVSTTSISDVSKISYTINGGSNQKNTNVYLIYSSDGNTFTQMSTTSGTQGAAISSETAYEFAKCSGYFGLLFKGTNSSGNWRIDDVNITFYKAKSTKTLSSITVTDNSQKNWQAGETVSNTDLKIVATYSSGNPETITNGNGVYFDSNHSQTSSSVLVQGSNTITVYYTDSYGSVSNTVTISAIAPLVLDTIAVETAPTKTDYIENENFDPTGLVIRRNYEGGTHDTYTYANHTSEFTFNPSTSTALTTSDTSVTITYGGKTTTQAITVDVQHGTESNPYTVAEALAAPVAQGVYVTGIISTITEVSTSYGNATYRISDDGTTTGEMIVYRGKYVNNTSFTSSDQIKLGDIVVVTGNLTVYSNANQLAQNNYIVTLTRKELSSITVSGYTDSYYIGETFTFGGIVTASYTDSTSADVTASATITSPDLSSTGSKTVNVSYTEGGIEKTTSYTVTVNSRTLSSISVSTSPTKTSYYVGENFDPAGLVITTVWNVGSDGSVSYADNSSAFEFSPGLDVALTKNHKSVIISYGGKSTTQSITVTQVDRFELITTVEGLSAGCKYVIGNATGTKFLSTTQNQNNRGAHTLEGTIVKNVVAYEEGMEVIELGGAAGAWTLKATAGTGSALGYLRAGSSSSNYLHTNASSSTWTITFSGTTPTLTSQYNSYTRNILKNNGDLFSCYNSGQTDVALYKLIDTSESVAISKSSVSGLKTDSDNTVSITANNFTPEDIEVSYSVANVAAVTKGTIENGIIPLNVSFTGVGTTVATITVTGGESEYDAELTITVAAKPDSLVVSGNGIALVDGGQTVANRRLEIQTGTEKQFSAIHFTMLDTDENNMSATASDVTLSRTSGDDVVTFNGAKITAGSTPGSCVVRFASKLVSSVYFEITVNVVVDYNTSVNSITYKEDLVDDQGHTLDISAVFATKIANTHFGSTSEILDSELKFSYEDNDYANAVSADSFVYDFEHGTTSVAFGEGYKDQTVFVYATFTESRVSSFEITIAQADTPLVGISLDTGSAYNLQRNTTHQLVVTYNPSDTTDNRSVTYSLSGASTGSTISVDDTGLISAGSKVGSVATITATVDPDQNPETENSVSASVVVTVTRETQTVHTIKAQKESWDLVTDASSLAVGDKLIMAEPGYGKTATNISSQIFQTAETTFNTDDTKIENIGEGTLIFTLGGSSSAWTLTATQGLLYATAVKKLAWDSTATNASSTWTISIDGSNNATILNTQNSYGRFLYNYNNGGDRFIPYATTTSTSSTMVLPKLYRLSGGTVELDKEVSDTLFNKVMAANACFTCDFNAGISFAEDKSWESVKEALSELTGDDLYIMTYGVGIDAYTREGATHEGNEVQNFLSVYDYLVTYKGYDNFLNRNISSAPSRINPILALNEVDNSVWIISAVALVGLTAIGGYFFYRKRKEI